MLDYYYYNVITNIKNKSYQTYLTLTDRKKSDISISYQDLALLFMIDNENINKPIYSGEELLEINKVITGFKNGNNNSLTFSPLITKKLLLLTKQKRISSSMNEELLLSYADIYNSNYTTDGKRIDKNTLHTICQSIKDN